MSHLNHQGGPPDSLTTRNYRVKDVFGFNSQMELQGYAPGHSLVPEQTPGYVWDAGICKDLIEWLVEDCPDPLWISGPTGCGKTELLKNLFARLHIPAVIVSAKKSSEPDDILGRVQLINGSTRFVPGPLLQAYAAGYAIVFDEIDSYNPEVMMAAHRLLERQTVVLDDGTSIMPAKRLYLAATANTRGDGDGQDLYAATSIFNIATINRFEKLAIGYPAAEVEEKILSNALPDLDRTVVATMVKVATDIRLAWQQGSCPGPISIRDLKRWGRKLLLSGQRTDVVPLYHAFDKALGFAVDPHVRSLLHKFIETHFNVPAPQILTPTIAA